jgi:hypothetical protein
MAGERILYVCFDPALLISRERLLLEEEFEVETVLGQDGVMSISHLHDIDYVLIGDEGSLPERQSTIRRLKEGSVLPPIVALCRPTERLRDADYQILAENAESWCRALASHVRRQRRLA